MSAQIEFHQKEKKKKEEKTKERGNFGGAVKSPRIAKSLFLARNPQRLHNIVEFNFLMKLKNMKM